jgi:hypothetical protein
MAFDTPATIAVLGAGPIGLEAALYARFLGYQVRIFEQGEVAGHVRRWGHVRMFTPFSMNCSTLGRAALAAQDEDYRAPDDDAYLTGSEWVDRYLLPLSETDLLSDELSRQTTVLSVTRWGAAKSDWVGDEQREETPFRILVRTADGNEREETADIVIDTTGVYGTPNWLGPGGAPALGEMGLRPMISTHLPDVLGEDRDRFAGRRTLLVGSGYSAATAVQAWRDLAAQFPETRLVWLTQATSNSPSGPVIRHAEDSLPLRDQLAREVNQLVSEGADWLCHQPAAQVRAIRRTESGWEVQLSGPPDDQGGDGKGIRVEPFDELLGLVGYRGDWSLVSELQVHLCYATEGPMKLASRLLSQPTADCLSLGGQGPEALMTPEPHFYVLGAKSYGRNSQFLYAEGLRQIRDLFSVIGERADLDLYAGARSLPR